MLPGKQRIHIAEKATRFRWKRHRAALRAVGSMLVNLCNSPVVCQPCNGASLADFECDGPSDDGGRCASEYRSEPKVD